MKKLNHNVQTLDLIGGEAAKPTELEPIVPTHRRKDGRLVSERTVSEQMQEKHRAAMSEARSTRANQLGKAADKVFATRMSIAFATCPGGSKLVSQLKG